MASPLDLDSPRWSELRHAYGDASDIPEPLRQLEDFPPHAAYEDEPWFSLWSALSHQGDIYSASFAAVPHVVRVIATDPMRADFSYFQFPAWVEVCRVRTKTPVPDDLAPSYFEALSRIPSLVAASAAQAKWEDNLLLSALAAIAASKGAITVAEVVLELTPDVLAELPQWLAER